MCQLATLCDCGAMDHFDHAVGCKSNSEVAGIHPNHGKHGGFLVDFANGQAAEKFLKKLVPCGWMERALCERCGDVVRVTVPEPPA